MQGPANPMGPGPQSEAAGYMSEQSNQQQFAQPEYGSTNSDADRGRQQRDIATTTPLPAPTVARTLAETNQDAVDSAPPVVDSRTPQSFRDQQPATADTVPYEDQRIDSVFSGSQFTDELDESLDTGRIVAEDQPQRQQETQFDSGDQYSAPLRPVQAVRNLESNQPPAYETVSEDVENSSELQQSDPHEQQQDYSAFESSVSNVHLADDTDQSIFGEVAWSSEESINAEATVEETVQDIEDLYGSSGDDSTSPSTEQPGTRVISNTIDLDTLRAELGAAPINQEESAPELAQADSDASAFDFQSLQEDLEQQEDQSNTVEDSTLEPLESLHEKIKNLTDPSRLNRPESDTIES